MGRNEETPPWVNYLDWNVLGDETPGGFVVYEVAIKVRTSGLLAVVKVAKGADRLVGFIGGRKLESLSREIRKSVRDEEFTWRKDKYFNT